MGLIPGSVGNRESMLEKNWITAFMSEGPARAMATPNLFDCCERLIKHKIMERNIRRIIGGLLAFLIARPCHIDLGVLSQQCASIMKDINREFGNA